MICIDTILEFNFAAGFMINGGGHLTPLLKFTTSSHRQILLFQQNNRCFYCDKKIYHPDRGLLPIATVDHVKPLCDGGKNELKNKVMACETCNQRKGCLPLDKFLGEAQK